VLRGSLALAKLIQYLGYSRVHCRNVIRVGTVCNARTGRVNISPGRLDLPNSGKTQRALRKKARLSAL
jgi:hypothetical protein